MKLNLKTKNKSITEVKEHKCLRLIVNKTLHFERK